MKSIKSKLFGLLLILSLVIPGGGILAQEVTEPAPDDTPTLEVTTPAPEVTPDESPTPPVIVVITPTQDPAFTPVPTEPPDGGGDDDGDNSAAFWQAAFTIAIVVGGILLGLFGLTVRAWGVQIIKLIPSIFRPGVYVTGDGFVAEMRRRAAETADLADDEAAEKFAREWEQIKREVDGVVIQAARRKGGYSP